MNSFLIERIKAVVFFFFLDRRLSVKITTVVQIKSGFVVVWVFFNYPLPDSSELISVVRLVRFQKQLVTDVIFFPGSSMVI